MPKDPAVAEPLEEEEVEVSPQAAPAPQGLRVVLRHLHGCPRGRVEKYPEVMADRDDAGNIRRVSVVVVRCVDCGAHEVAGRDLRAKPNTPDDFEEVEV